jgi:hypothetical protein
VDKLLWKEDGWIPRPRSSRFSISFLSQSFILFNFKYTQSNKSFHCLKMSVIFFCFCFFWNITQIDNEYIWSRCQHPQRGLCSNCMPIAVHFNFNTPHILNSFSQYKPILFGV